MKTYRFPILAAIFLAITFTFSSVGCGDGTPKVDYPKIPTHPIYGDLPQLEVKWDDKNKALKEQKEAAFSKVKNADAATKARAKYDKLKEEAEAQEKKEMEEAFAKIKKEFPFEVKDDVGYTVSSVTIVSPAPSFVVDLKVTDKSKLDINLIKVWKVHFDLIDDSGNSRTIQIYPGSEILEAGQGKSSNFAISGYTTSKFVFVK
jgi:hypothetical protein